jgi:anti-sigma regulatory factor (Ser/Thr protein kinase)
MGTERRIYINNDLDIVVVRMQAREMAKQMGFGTADQARVSLAASELARVLSWKTDESGEIVMSDISENGQHYQVSSKDETNLTQEASVSSRSFAGACQLVDESIVEEQDNNQARVTLKKWLK